jgi:hypothetical protein
MLLASTFERVPAPPATPIAPWRPVNLSGSVTAARVADGTAYSGGAFLRASTTAIGGSVAVDLNALRRIPGTNDFMVDSNIAVMAWVRTAPGGPNMNGSLTVWHLGKDPSNPANHPNTLFAVNNTWTLVSNAIEMVSGPYDLRVEFYLNTMGTSLDVDCVFVN